MTDKERTFPVMEIFGPTVQGEGAMIGTPTYFIRFGGCDYRCTACDSKFAVEPESVKRLGQRLTANAIVKALKAQHVPGTTEWVTLSGGNPAMYNLEDLLLKLRMAGWKIALETQGSICPKWLVLVDNITVSPKGPGMGISFGLDDLVDFQQALIRALTPDKSRSHVTYKVVIFTDEDIEFAAAVAKIVSPTNMRLSLGNPIVPGDDQLNIDDHRRLLLEAYEELLPKVLHHPILNAVPFLPQWHVMVFGNRQGV